MGFFSRMLGSSGAGKAQAAEQVNQYILNNPVVAFTKSYCPYCASTKSLLKKLGANAVIIDMDRVDGGKAMQDALKTRDGQRTVPNIYIRQEHIGGNSEIQKLHKSGQLVPKLEAAGAMYHPQQGIAQWRA